MISVVVCGRMQVDSMLVRCSRGNNCFNSIVLCESQFKTHSIVD